MKHFLLVLFLLWYSIGHGQTVTVCGPMQIPAGYVTVAMARCSDNGRYAERRTLQRIDNLPPGSSVTICNTPVTAIPAGWITTQMSTYRSTNSPDVYEGRTIRRFAGSAPGQEMQICNVPVAYRPAGWATIAIGRTSYQGTWLETRTIKNLIGMPVGSSVSTIDTPEGPRGSIHVIQTNPGTTPTGSSSQVTVILRWPPSSAGWVTTACGTAMVNGNTYETRTFRLAAGSAPGTEIPICNSYVPDGWATTAIGTCRSGTSVYESRTIKCLIDMAPGSTVRTLDTPELGGWVTTGMTTYYIGVKTYEGRTLKRAHGCAPGTVIQTCNATFIPAGWLVTARGTCYNGVKSYRAQTITCLGAYRTASPTPLASDSGAVDSPASALLVFPNPASDQVEVRLAGDIPNQPQRVEVRDMMGQLVSQGMVSDQSAKFTLPAGLYFVRVGTMTKRLLVR